MIPEGFINEWRSVIEWQMSEQIEQDLIISRALIDLYNNEHVKNALVFRGGTALNKLFLKPPSRYSEDIDFVQLRAAPIGPTIDAIKDMLNPWLGEPKRKLTQRSAKLIYKYQSVTGDMSKLKIEINTTEHFQVLPLKIIPFNVESRWYSGVADIVTYDINELMATKLRALYQRRKGRDLFDMWYVMTQGLIDLNRVFDIFHQYCIYNNMKITRDAFLENLELKKHHRDFHIDMRALLPAELNWNFDEAYQYVIDNLINKM